MAYQIRRGRLDEYRRWNLQKTLVGFSLRISCPACGRTITVHNIDLIELDGGMRTTLVCPFDPCKFSESNVRLKGWDPYQLE